MNKITSVIMGGGTALPFNSKKGGSVRLTSSLIPNSARKEEGIDNRFEMRWLYG